MPMEQITLPTGDILKQENRAIVVELTGARRVLSTSILNGGCRTDLSHLFNYCEVYGRVDELCEMRASTYKEHLKILARELGLNAFKVTGLSTAAKMKYAQLKSKDHGDFSVTAVATGGIDVNGSRAGDPAFWHEKNGRPVPYKPGTINILVFINANLGDAALARALVTVTEAKAAALQEVLAPSCYSRGLATGSGTDGTIIVSNMDSQVTLSDAGQHSKLGEYLGRVVKNTVKAGLVAENGFEAYACTSMLRRIGRFGIDEESLWERYCRCGRPGDLSRETFGQRLKKLNQDKELMALAPVYAHILDLLDWNLVRAEEAAGLAVDLLAEKRGGPDVKRRPDQWGQSNEANPARDLSSLPAGLKGKSNREALEHLTGCFAWFLIEHIAGFS